MTFACGRQVVNVHVSNSVAMPAPVSNQAEQTRCSATAQPATEHAVHFLGLRRSFCLPSPRVQLRCQWLLTPTPSVPLHVHFSVLALSVPSRATAVHSTADTTYSPA